jgi:replication factor C small subunit
MLWTEKYRPKKLNEIVGQESFKLDAENWIEIDDMPNILFFGPAGTGKTASGIALSNDILGEIRGPNFLELNASDDRRLETVRTYIKDFAKHGKLGSVPFKICLLDEMDGMTTDAQNALKRIMERYSDNIRFIITCNDRSKIIYPIQSRCANYFFERLSDDVIESVIKQILIAEGKDLPTSDDLITFIASFHGDLRRVITEIQAAISADRPLELQVNKALEEYALVIDHIVNNHWNDASDKLFKMSQSGMTVKNICVGLHEAIINAELSSNTKYKYLRVIGEAEWRSQVMTPRILLSWVVAQCR